MTTLSKYEDADGLSDEKVLDAVFGKAPKRKRARKAKVSKPALSPCEIASQKIGAALIELERALPGCSANGLHRFGYVSNKETGELRYPEEAWAFGVVRALNEAVTAASLMDGLRILAGIGADRG